MLQLIPGCKTIHNVVNKQRTEFFRRKKRTYNDTWFSADEGFSTDRLERQGVIIDEADVTNSNWYKECSSTQNSEYAI